MKPARLPPALILALTSSCTLTLGEKTFPDIYLWCIRAEHANGTAVTPQGQLSDYIITDENGQWIGGCQYLCPYANQLMAEGSTGQLSPGDPGFDAYASIRSQMEEYTSARCDTAVANFEDTFNRDVIFTQPGDLTCVDALPMSQPFLSEHLKDFPATEDFCDSQLHEIYGASGGADESSSGADESSSGADDDDEGMDSQVFGPQRYGLASWSQIRVCTNPTATTTVCSIDRQFFDEMMAEPSLLFHDKCRIEDLSTSLPGMTVQSCDSRSLLYQLGLRSGDVIRTVEGRPVNSFEDALAASGQLATDPSIVGTLRRVSTTRTHTLQRVDMPTYP